MRKKKEIIEKINELRNDLKERRAKQDNSPKIEVRENTLEAVSLNDQIFLLLWVLNESTPTK